MDELDFVKIEVGEKFPLFPDSVERLKGTDGAYLEVSESGHGYLFCVHLSDVGFMDKKSFREDTVKMKVLQGTDGMVIPMIKFGKNLLFEMVFDPTLYEDDRAFQFTDSNNIITLILIESNNGEVKAIRQCNLPLKMIQICKEAWGRAILDLNFSPKYTEWTQRMSKYPLREIWNRATNVGELGETYDIQEITTPNQYKPQGDDLL